MKRDFQNLGLLKTYFYPSLVLFVIPVFSLWFFNHAESTVDREMLASIEQEIRHDAKMSKAQRARALAFFREVPISRLLKLNAPEFQHLKTIVVQKGTGVVLAVG